MATVEQGPTSSGLVERIKAILFSPEATWSQIDTEPATVKGLYVGYACILAAIGPIAQFVGGQLFGYHALWISFRPPLITSLVGAIVSYLLGLAGIYVFALIIDALAPQFGGQKNKIQAFKVAVYSGTAAWIAGVFALIPQVSMLSIVGVYSLYLLYVGLPKLMKAPQDKALTYTIVSVVLAVVVWIVIAAVSTSIVGMGGAGLNVARNAGTVNGVVSVGGTQVDLGKLQAASKQMEQAANQMQNAASGSSAPAVKAVPADTLKAMLPASLGSGFARSEISSASGGVGGLQGSNAEGVYTKGDARITLTVTDVAAAGAFASMASAFNVQSDQETSTGYEKVHSVNGRMTQESWDRTSKSGKYSVMVANRFVVEAQGEGAEMADLKAAVDAVGPGKLEGLAKTG
jgi:hypothetical protein